MNQPSYHLELLIAGFGALLALAIGAFAIWDMSWVPWNLLQSESNSITIGLFLLPIIYTTGIMVDWVVDLFLGRYFIPKINEQVFKGDRQGYMRARTLIYYRSDNLKSVFEYSRVRIRILRAWMLNSFLIGVASMLFLIFPPKPVDGLPEAAFCHFVISNRPLLSFLVLSGTVFSVWISFVSWRAMTLAECRNLLFQSHFLESIDKKKETTQETNKN